MSKIKLIDIIKELNVNNSRITPELVTDYWENKIYLNKDYGRLRDKYLIKLNLGYMSTEHLIEKLSYPDLVEFYKDLKQLYNKQQGINELEINKRSDYSNLPKDEIDEYINHYLVKYLKDNYDMFYLIDSEILKYEDLIQNIILRDNEIDHNEIDSEFILEYFNQNILPIVHKELWKVYWKKININKIKQDIYKNLVDYNYEDTYDLDYIIKRDIEFNLEDHIPELVIQDYLDDTIYKVLKHYEPNDLNELQINPSIQWRPFRNNNFEKGKTVKETIINFIKANPYQPEIIITTNIGLRRWYHPKVVLDNLRDTLNMGVVRKQVINPTTKRKVWIYYLSQDKLFELNINPNRITRGDIYSILINSNVSNNFMNNVGIINKYAETQYWESWMEGLNKIEDKDLNKCYNELKQINGD